MGKQNLRHLEAYTTRRAALVRVNSTKLKLSTLFSCFWLYRVGIGCSTRKFEASFKLLRPAGIVIP